jgi:hypothetical protein
MREDQALNLKCPKYEAEPHHASNVELAPFERGFTLSPNSQVQRCRHRRVWPEGRPDEAHAAATRHGSPHLWWLDFAKHSGRRERRPCGPQLDELLEMVATQSLWTIADMLGNPERASDGEA